MEQAHRWLEEMDQRIHVHQLRQFLQTSSLVTPDGVLSLMQHFLAKPTKTDAIRDKMVRNCLSEREAKVFEHALSKIASEAGALIHIEKVLK